MRWKCWDWGSFQFLWCVSEAFPLTLALSRRERELTELFGRGTPTWDTELNSRLKAPPFDSLFLEERGLTEVFGRGMPTWDTEVNSGFEQHFNRLLTTQHDER